MKIDKISIKNLELFAKHGMFPEENSLGQKFIISAELFTDFRMAGKLDELENSLDYGRNCHIIRRFVEDNTFRLIETVAERLAEKLLLENPALHRIKLEIKKPWAPVAMHLETISVEIERSRHRAFVALGSNIGDREAYVRFALSEIGKARGCRISKVSKFINTPPYGNEDQGDFLNGCIEIDTLLTPHELLELLQDIEHRAGRVRAERWGPRTLDLDIIFFDDLIMSDSLLRIPHPEAHKREFVLEPLCEIAQYALHPVYLKTAAELLEALQG